MEKSVLDISDSVRYQKQGLKTSYVSDIEGTFVVNLCSLNIENYFFYTKLSLNDDDNNYEEPLNYTNYRETVKKLHDSG